MIRLVVPHGLGDLIQALPSLEALARRHGEQLDIGVLDRLPACRELLEAQPYVGRVFGTVDPWRDFTPPDTWEGYAAGMRFLADVHCGTLLRTAPPYDPTSRLVCKAARIADELGVPWEPVQPSLGRLWFAPDAVRARTKLDEDGKPLYVLAHGESGNPRKDVDWNTLAAYADSAAPVVRIPVPGASLAWHLGVMERAVAVIGVDSGPAHLASCTRTRVVWVFTETPIEQAIPLWRDVEVIVRGPRADELLASWEAWRRANASLVQFNVRVGKEVSCAAS